MATSNYIGFLRGSQENFDKLNAYKAGSFYLTSDAGRLYYANTDSSYLELNQYVHQVASVDDLAAQFASAKVGDFYYAIKENVLCTKKSGATSWTQINPDTNTNDDTQVTEIAFERDTSVSDKIKMNLILKQTTKHVDNTTTVLEEKVGSFELTEDDFNAVVTGANVVVNSAVADGVAHITTGGTGAGSDDAGVSISGAGSITISGSEDAIVITGQDTTYKMSSPAGDASVILTQLSDNSSKAITFTEGTDIIINGATADQINVAHKAYNYQNTALEAQTPAAGGSFDIVSGVSLSNGHVTGVSTSKVTLPGEKWYNVTEVEATDEGDINITVTGQDNSSTVVTADGQLFYKVGDTTVYNQADLTRFFYTETEIDDKLNGLNAMTYRGTVGTSSGTVVSGAIASLPTVDDGTIKIGDTYMVVGTDGVDFGGVEDAVSGDLLIATGAETNGIITGALIWTHVPSANEIDTTYTLDSEGASIVLTSSGNVKQYVELVEGTAIDIAQASSGGIEIKHENVTRTDPEKEEILGRSFDVVSSVTTNAQGHVTAVQVNKVTIPEDIDTTYSLVPDAAQNSVALTDKNNASVGAITINGADDYINVTSTGVENNITYSVFHSDVARSDDATGTLAPAAGGTVQVVTGVSSDAKGHVTSVKTSTMTMPKDTTYTYAGTVSSANNVATISSTLTDSENAAKGTAAYTLNSNSLAISSSGNAVTLDMQWGSF